MSKLKPNIDPSLYKLGDMASSDISISSHSEECALEIVKAEFNEFESFDWENESHRRAYLDIAPVWLYETAHKVDRARFHTMVRYDPKEKCLVSGCFDEKFVLVSYKYRKRWDRKWVARKGTHPNRHLAFRILRTRSNPVYFIEGHRDALTALLLGLNFIMIPYAGFKLREASVLTEETYKKELIFIVEDEAAYKCMTKIVEQLTDTAQSIKLIELDDTEGKVDLSDYVQRFNSIKEVINGLQNRR